MDRETELRIVRRAYARHILWAFNVVNPAVEAAYAAVPRERYVGPGPWQIFRIPGGYVSTPDDDPVFIYADNLVGLIPARYINNGQPSLHAALITNTGLRPGERVVHVGAGTGYYTAILAHLVGPTGRVVGYEFEAELAERARTNLAPLAKVEVIHGDAMAATLAGADLIYVNASVSRLPMSWLDGLSEGGRLLVPMAAREVFTPFMSSEHPDPAKLGRAMGRSAVFLITRKGEAFNVRWIGPAAFIPAQGAGDDASEAALSAAFEKGSARKVTRLVRGESVRPERRWLSGEGWCLAYD
jgi:protein-L-isoaspartate(D-aspartate) O-methyltransferase